jgi:hypothetical protein
VTSPEQFNTAEQTKGEPDGNSLLLPKEFQYSGPPMQAAQVNDSDRFYIPRTPAGESLPSPTRPDSINPPDRGQPMVSPEYQGTHDKEWPLNQEAMRRSEGSFGPTWLLERGVGLLGTSIAAARFDPHLAERLPLGREWPTVASMQSITRADWQRTIPGQYGKLLGGAFIADTVADQMFFSDKTSSSATMAVDFGVPMAAKWLLSRYSWPVGLALSVAAHVAEKAFLEEKR